MGFNQILRCITQVVAEVLIGNVAEQTPQSQRSGTISEQMRRECPANPMRGENQADRLGPVLYCIS